MLADAEGLRKRIESYGADYEFVGVSVYGARGVGCGAEGDWER